MPYPLADEFSAFDRRAVILRRKGQDCQLLPSQDEKSPQNQLILGALFVDNSQSESYSSSSAAWAAARRAIGTRKGEQDT